MNSMTSSNESGIYSFAKHDSHSLFLLLSACSVLKAAVCALTNWITGDGIKRLDLGCNGSVQTAVTATGGVLKPSQQIRNLWSEQGYKPWVLKTRTPILCHCVIWVFSLFFSSYFSSRQSILLYTTCLLVDRKLSRILKSPRISYSILYSTETDQMCFHFCIWLCKDNHKVCLNFLLPFNYLSSISRKLKLRLGFS